MRKNLRACLSLFRIRMAESLQYRVAALAGVANSSFWVMIEVTVYTVFFTLGAFRDNTALTLAQVVSYSWLSQTLFGIVFIDIDPEMRAKITNGDIGLELCRPMDFYAHWLAKTMAGRLGGAFWRLVITFALGVLFPIASYRLALPASAAGLGLFLASVAGAFLLAGSYSMFLTAVRLGISWGEGPTYILGLVAMVLGGGYLPLQLWPDFLQKILLFQPFAGAVDIPARLYIGSLPPAEGLFAIGLQLFWSAVFIAAGRLLTRRKLGQLVVQGG